jgi:hypothetical protein
VGVLQRKRRRSGCTSAPSRHSVKVKCPDWNLDRQFRSRGAYGSRTKPLGLALAPSLYCYAGPDCFYEPERPRTLQEAVD